jgi:hypothetical protein
MMFTASIPSDDSLDNETNGYAVPCVLRVPYRAPSQIDVTLIRNDKVTSKIPFRFEPVSASATNEIGVCAFHAFNLAGDPFKFCRECGLFR